MNSIILDWLLLNCKIAVVGFRLFYSSITEINNTPDQTNCHCVVFCVL